MNPVELSPPALDQAPFAVMIFDAQGVVHYANGSFRFLCGHLYPAPGSNENGALQIPADDALLQNWKNYSSERECAVKSEWLRNPESDEFFYGVVRLQAYGNQTLACFYAQDLSELRLTYRSLRSTMETFHAIFNLAPDVISLTRMSDNVVVQVNKAYEKLSGYDASHLLGRTSIDSGAWKNPSDRLRLLEGLMAHGRVECMPVEMLDKQGNILHVSVSSVVVQLHGEPHMLSIFRDISEQVRNERDLRELNQQLEERVTTRTQELSRLNQELESYIYTLSHDLRSPIRAISGFSALLREQGESELSEDNRILLNRIESAAKRMMQMTDDLLRLARLSRSAVERKTLSLARIAEEVHKDFEAHHPERHVELICKDPLTAWGDPQLLRHVIENLISNAWKYTSTKPNATIRLWSEADIHNQTRFLIQDNGVGFDSSYAQRLFQPFYRMHKDSEFPGTGIGLATVARIVYAHGGQVGASATPGGGAMFWFSLPNQEDNDA
ncbi:sensor histidine kinase [Permianibacter aggregans]|uniref:histidine kinase n=1 Tax=Permianibacter aggregans TaxID=1510150 RepID=A0A4R6UH93_9GAMM|nr:PAS domain-containing sensor histidine kinase [Permianibacter aggregans]QGX39057.1 PAS domain-containing sensor histidine kinase [Permianibacter aggregans]TDQ44603.1 PAS/PAC sensor signal transduction histidine kinase [Permianibacter aggregans]